MAAMRRFAFLPLVVVIAACSTEEQLNPQPLPPQDEGNGRSPSAGGAADSSLCNGTCCQRPAEGSTCDSSEDTTCSWAVTCPSGLVLPYEVTCMNGTWQLTNGCPKDGETDARGCPAKQPENGSGCALTGSTSQCGYVLQCTNYRKSALATCSGNAWQTTPLGGCD